jgi:hypothetical protein
MMMGLAEDAFTLTVDDESPVPKASRVVDGVIRDWSGLEVFSDMLLMRSSAVFGPAVRHFRGVTIDAVDCNMGEVSGVKGLIYLAIE